MKAYTPKEGMKRFIAYTIAVSWESTASYQAGLREPIENRLRIFIAVSGWGQTEGSSCTQAGAFTV